MRNLEICWIVLVVLIPLAASKKIALLANTGVTSHDALMKRVGRLLATHGHEISFIQIRVFDFNQSLPTDDPEPNWKYKIQHASSPGSNSLLDWIQSVMWLTNIPYDFSRPLIDPQMQATAIFKMFDTVIGSCYSALRDPSFLNHLRNQSFDLVVTDFMLNECMIALQSLYDSPVVFVSNYLLITGYREHLNIPSIPSYVPMFFESVPPSMNFKERIINLLGYSSNVALTYFHHFKTRRVFRDSSALPHLDLGGCQTSQALIYLNPFEFLLDMPRPINRRVKHIGCPRCYNKQTPLKLEALGIAESPLYSGIVVLSFGGTVSGKRMPVSVREVILKTMGRLNYTVIWQFGSDLEGLNLTIPPNVHLRKWVPLPQLLAHPELKLLITHGGIQTLLEAQFRTPILLIPLHGDQKYNVRRMVDKGVAEFLETPDLTEANLYRKVTQILYDPEKYRIKNERLKSHLMEHKKLEALSGQQVDEFWYLWTLRHGDFLRKSGRYFRLEYKGDFYDWQLDTVLLLLGLIVIPIILLSDTIFLRFMGFLSRFRRKDSRRVSFGKT